MYSDGASSIASLWGFSLSVRKHFIHTSSYLFACFLLVFLFIRLRLQFCSYCLFQNGSFDSWHWIDAKKTQNHDSEMYILFSSSVSVSTILHIRSIVIFHGLCVSLWPSATSLAPLLRSSINEYMNYTRIDNFIYYVSHLNLRVHSSMLALMRVFSPYMLSLLLSHYTTRHRICSFAMNWKMGALQFGLVLVYGLHYTHRHRL